MTKTPSTPQVDLIGLIVNREAADRALIHPRANAAARKEHLGKVWDVDEPRARTTDPETSHEAAASVRNRTATQDEILRVLSEEGPSTDERIAGWYESPPASPSGIRTRRAELVAQGKVVNTGKRAHVATGRMAIVWGLAPEADRE